MQATAHSSVGQTKHIVIVGGGVIGATTAYFLSRHPKYDRTQHRVTVLEASTIAAGASGKAGGLLGLWAYPQELVPLSFRLHKQLAHEHDGAKRWGYRSVGCGHIQAEVTQADLDRRAKEVEAAKAAKVKSGDAPQSLPSSAPSAAVTAADAEVSKTESDQKEWEKLPKQDAHASSLLSPSVLPPDLDWIDPAVVQSYDRMGVPEAFDTAQVHPFYFTTSMAELAKERGVQFRTDAQVTKIGSSSSNEDSKGLHTIEYLDRDTNTTQVLEDVTDVVVSAGDRKSVV